MVVHLLYVAQEFVYVHVVDKEVVQTVLGLITVTLVCHIVLDQDVTVQVQVETMQVLHTVVTSKVLQLICIQVVLVTVGNT